MTIGKLVRVPLREVWKHEAQDFTRWLQENYDVLNEVLDITLTNVEREQPAGDFSVDLVAEDESGNTVIIENQLGKSDHDHLGKLITYLTAFGARTAIWIVGDPRPEHVSAVNWLNESAAASFYLIKVEAVRVDAPGHEQPSPPAPLLTLIVGPSETNRAVGETKKELAERDVLRHPFWAELLERARKRTQLHAGVSPGTGSAISTGAGRAGLTFSYAIRQHNAQVRLYIDRGDAADNKKLFDALAAKRDQIEAAFGEPLTWERPEVKRACRISKTVDTGGYRDDNWSEVQDAMIDAMIRLEQALRPYIDRPAL